jgi:pyridoxine 4-dehydrogenase
MRQPVQPSTNMRKASKWSRLGLGTGTLASLGRAASFSEVDRLVGAMLDLGVTVIDTADSYGSGDCERLVGKVLRGRRESFIVVTKSGYRLSNLPGPFRPLNQFAKKGFQRLGFHQCFAPAYLAKCLDNSLSRLGVKHLDAFLLHNPSLKVVEDERVIHLCKSLIESGKTILTGLSSENPEVIRTAIASGVFKIIQTPASLKAAVAMRPLWKECETNGIRVIGNHVFDPACLGVHGMTHETLMRSTSALLPNGATILCGTRNLAHLQQACEWAAMPLPEADAVRELLRVFP